MNQRFGLSSYLAAKKILLGCCALVLALVWLFFAGHAVAAAESTTNPAAFSDLRRSIAQVSRPELKPAAWMKTDQASNPVFKQSASPTKTIPYTVSTRGIDSSGIEEFKLLADQTLNDPRGWSRIGVKFVPVEAGGQFGLILATPSEVGAVAGCSSEWSCRYGRDVLVNLSRWMDATPSWNASGGNLRDYRHMVVNHEVGHWIGHDHEDCAGAGQLAPVMLQQSIDLQGCRFNPWPLTHEVSAALAEVKL
jgi:hypothetical protein